MPRLRTLALLASLLALAAPTPALAVDLSGVVLNLTVNGSKVCGPEKGWDCRTGEAQGQMLLAYAALFNATDDDRYVIPAKSLAQASISGAAGCTACACGGGVDRDCGTAVDQASLVLGLLGAFKATGQPVLFGKAKEYGDSATGECGPDADFDIGTSDWVCGDVMGQGLMVLAYAGLYEATGERRYLDAMRKLASNCDSLHFKGSLHPCALGLVRAYHVTRDAAYKEQFLATVAERQGPARTLLDNLVFNRFTGDGRYLTWALQSGGEGSDACGPASGVWDCGNPSTQGWYMVAYAALAERTGDGAFKDALGRLSDVRTPCGTYDEGDAWECDDPRDQAALLLGLASAWGGRDAYTPLVGLDAITPVGGSRQEVGASCGSSADCLSSNCRNRVCCLGGQACCATDAHCPPEARCDAVRHYCVAAAPSPGAPPPAAAPECTPCPDVVCPSATPAVTERVVEREVTVTVPAATTCPEASPYPAAGQCPACPAASPGPGASACPSCPAPIAPTGSFGTGAVLAAAFFGLLAGLIGSALASAGR